MIHSELYSDLGLAYRMMGSHLVKMTDKICFSTVMESLIQLQLGQTVIDWSIDWGDLAGISHCVSKLEQMV